MARTEELDDPDHRDGQNCQRNDEADEGHVAARRRILALNFKIAREQLGAVFFEGGWGSLFADARTAAAEEDVCDGFDDGADEGEGCARS
jgi:hypothetical protein